MDDVVSLLAVGHGRVSLEDVSSKAAFVEGLRGLSPFVSPREHYLYFERFKSLDFYDEALVEVLFSTEDSNVAALVCELLASQGNEVGDAVLVDYVKRGDFWELAFNAGCRHGRGVDALEGVVVSRLDEQCKCLKGVLNTREVSASVPVSRSGGLWGLSLEEGLSRARVSPLEEPGRSYLLTHGVSKDGLFFLRVIDSELSSDAPVWEDVADALWKCSEFGLKVKDDTLKRLWVSPYPYVRSLVALLVGEGSELFEVVKREGVFDADVLVRERSLSL